jgi:hypothetical protein
MGRDRRTVVFVGVAAAALVALVVIVTFVWVEDSGDDGAPAPVELAGRNPGSVHPGVVALEISLLAVFVAFAGFAIWRIVRQRGPKFDELPPEEQQRREEAGQLLHDLGRPSAPRRT